GGRRPPTFLDWEVATREQRPRVECRSEAFRILRLSRLRRFRIAPRDSRVPVTCALARRLDSRRRAIVGQKSHSRARLWAKSACPFLGKCRVRPGWGSPAS